MEKCLFVHRKHGLFLSVFVDDIKMAAKNQNLATMWKKWMKHVDLDEPTSFLKPNEMVLKECRENVPICNKHRPIKNESRR